jgi:raffinose/stachyose/melibiose transport system substrate-binding protein
MKQRSLLLKVLISVIVFVFLVGCSQVTGTNTASPSTEGTAKPAEKTESTATPAKKITLTVTSWFDTNTMGKIYDEAWQSAGKDLGYEVVVDGMDSESFKTKSKVQLASGELPDVMTMWTALTYLEPFIEADAIIPLDSSMKSSGLSFQPAQLRPYYKDGVNYIVPVTTGNSFFIYYNRELVNKLGCPLPETMEDIEKIVEICRANNLDPIGLGIKDRWLADFFYMALVAREDPDAFRKTQTGDLDFSAEPFLKAAQTAQSLVEMGAFPKDALNITVPEMAEMFFAGRFPFMAEGGWRWTKLYDKMGDNLGYIRFPMTGSDTNYKETAMSNGPFGLIVSKNSKHIDEAAALAMKYAGIIGEYLAKNGRLNFLVTDTKPEAEIPEAYKQLMEDTAMLKKIVPAWSDDLVAEKKEKAYDLGQALFGGVLTAEEYIEQYSAMIKK